jgi:hypothetical protein
MEHLHKHCCYFGIAGITVRLESDLDFEFIRFKPELASFAVDSPSGDQVTLRHFFEWPDMSGMDLGEVLYNHAPWSISRKNGWWYYRNLPINERPLDWQRLGIFNPDHTSGTIYSPPGKAEDIRLNGWDSLSLFTTDQIWLAPVLADRNAVLLHSAAGMVNGKGFIFVGHSSSGKSTTMKLLKGAGIGAEILCDDRNIVRKWVLPMSFSQHVSYPHDRPELKNVGEWCVHGTWSHGTVADVSPNFAPLSAILFLQQASYNQVIPLTDRKEIWKRLLATLIKPMVTAEWWQKELDVLGQIVEEVPCYIMYFDKSGAIVDRLVSL